jgi:HSP20 family protein
MSLIKLKEEKELFPTFLTPTLINPLTPLNSIIEDFWGKDYLEKMETGRAIPAVNVSENKNEFEVDVAAPGFKKNEFNIEVKDNRLTISSEHKESKEEKEKKVTRKEFSYNSFERSFTLPSEVIEDEITAEYTDGLLKVHLPKKELADDAKLKKIDVI